MPFVTNVEYNISMFSLDAFQNFNVNFSVNLLLQDVISRSFHELASIELYEAEPICGYVYVFFQSSLPFFFNQFSLSLFFKIN